MGDTVSEPKPNLNYYYIKPVLNIPNLGLVAIIIFIFCYLIIRWNYIGINWENEKCNNANFFLAPLYGKNSADTLQQCSADIVAKSVSDSLGKLDIQSQIIDLSNNISSIMTEIKNSPSTAGASVSSTVSGTATILSGIQKNIDNIKTALTKVLGSVVLSSYMSNGVIQSSKSLENSNLVNIVSQYSEANKNLLNDMKYPMPKV